MFQLLMLKMTQDDARGNGEVDEYEPSDGPQHEAFMSLMEGPFGEGGFEAFEAFEGEGLDHQQRGYESMAERLDAQRVVISWLVMASECRLKVNPDQTRDGHADEAPAAESKPDVIDVEMFEDPSIPCEQFPDEEMPPGYFEDEQPMDVEKEVVE
ncbi:unnamed protein product, partial [Symbiodinium sp. KB8]